MKLESLGQLCCAVGMRFIALESGVPKLNADSIVFAEGTIILEFFFKIFF